MSKRQLTFYFTASIAAKDQYIKNYTQIIESVKANDINIIADHILNTSEPEVNSSSREKRLAFHRQLEEWIHKCDALIAETSYPSISVGYEISLALRVGKPVLVLYSGGEAPSLLAHHSDEKILTEKYNLSSLHEIIKDFKNFVESKADLRFTFFITPSIAAYLDSIVKDKKTPKSVYLRELIEKDMLNPPKKV